MLQTLLLTKRFNKTETPIFLSVVCSLFPKAIFFGVYCSIPSLYCYDYGLLPSILIILLGNDFAFL